jgi:hypothetical protein
MPATVTREGSLLAIINISVILYSRFKVARHIESGAMMGRDELPL